MNRKKDNILKATLFIVMLVGCTYVADIFYHILYIDSYYKRELPPMKIITDLKLDANILVVGSSRAWRNYNPNRMSQKLKRFSFNLGQPQENFAGAFAVLNYYLKRNSKPELVVINLDFHLLETFKINHLYKYMWVVKKHSSFLKELVKVDKKMELYRLPLIAAMKYNNANMYYTREIPEYLRAYSDGFGGMNKSWNNKLYLVNMDKYPNGISFDIKPEIVNKIEENLDFLDKNNIDYVFVFAPVLERTLKEFIVNEDEIFNFYENLAKKRGKKFYNLTTLPICKDTTYFYNGTHLNYDGANIFSDIVSDSIKVYLQKKAIHSPKK